MEGLNYIAAASLALNIGLGLAYHFTVKLWQIRARVNEDAANVIMAATKKHCTPEQVVLILQDAGNELEILKAIRVAEFDHKKRAQE